jgi:hypothetical protein
MTKCVRKHIVVMIELLVFILHDVQANDLAPSSLSLSSPPILLPYSFKLDEATGAMHKCIIDNVDACASSKRIWPFRDSKYEICIKRILWKCFFHANPIYHSKVMLVIKKIVMCANANCYPKMRVMHIHARSHFLSCVLECCEERNKRHSNMIYMQNP